LLAYRLKRFFFAQSKLVGFFSVNFKLFQRIHFLNSFPTTQ